MFLVLPYLRYLPFHFMSVSPNPWPETGKAKVKLALCKHKGIHLNDLSWNVSLISWQTTQTFRHASAFLCDFSLVFFTVRCWQYFIRKGDKSMVFQFSILCFKHLIPAREWDSLHIPNWYNEQYSNKADVIHWQYENQFPHVFLIVGENMWKA